tara:strand:+ start:8670 stop:9488 length:819 start_codon:yes stop_codon:yes gene_type:complete
MNIIVLSLPRSGSSFFTKHLIKKGFKLYGDKKNRTKSKNIFNRDGYFEDIKTNLLNDQLIRISNGSRYSFLYPPSKVKHKINKNYYYDLQEENIFFPKNYKKLKKKYTGFSWDVWGLTRMLKCGKWHKCYSRFNVESYRKIELEKKKLINFFKKNNGYVLKDPRFGLCYPHYQNIKNVKYIILKRDKKSLLKSLRKHYGKNLFKKIYLPDSNIVSNHFNYKVEYLSFNKYFRRYLAMIKKTVKKKKYIEIDINKIDKKKELNKLEKFLNTNK